MPRWVHVSDSEHTRRSKWATAIAHSTWKCGHCGALAVTTMINTAETTAPPTCVCGVCKR